MIIKCRTCGNTEQVNKEWFLKILGGGLVGTGFWAWVTYLMAGTGFAMAICVAIITGGAAILAYREKIMQWISNRNYRCPNCGSLNWES